MKYDKYKCEKCGPKLKDGRRVRGTHEIRYQFDLYYQIIT
ncbi:MAG: hypothetical protein ACLU4N_00975 [Butyricimonas faecihominis]